MISPDVISTFSGTSAAEVLVLRRQLSDPSKIDRKTIRIVRDVPEKVKKTSRESAVRSIVAAIYT